MPKQGRLSIERMCQLAGVSRASFYRSLGAREPVEEDMEVRSAIQKIFVEHKRRYGYRRVSKELRRRGMPVNRKRVARLMREDNLLAVQPKTFVVTTDSDHELEVYLVSFCELPNRQSWYGGDLCRSRRPTPSRAASFRVRSSCCACGGTCDIP